MGSSNDINDANDDFLKQRCIKNYPKAFPISALTIVQDQSKKCICKIFLKSGGTGTGFFCKIPFPTSFNLLPVLITTNHNLEEENIIPGEKINFLINNHQKSILIDESRKIYTYKGEEGDITIIEIKEEDGLEIESFLDIDNTKNNFTPKDYKENNIYIIHFPNGQNIAYSNGIIKYANDNNEEIFHTCDTKCGSSGSPIINMENYKVFGIHKGYIKSKNLNIGTLIKNHIKNFYKKVKEGNIIKGDEIKMKYKIGKDKKIRIFGDLFVENNINKCKIIYKGKEEELKSYIEIEDINNNELFEIKLKGMKNITDIDGLFDECISLINIEGLEYLDTKNITSMFGLFSKCTSLLSLPDISKWDTSKIIDMEGMFNHCEMLISLPNISKWNTSQVTNMACLFQSCYKLLSLPDISKWNTSKVTNMQDMFDYCEVLGSLPDISKWNFSKVTNMRLLFQCCYKLLSLPDISKWDTSKVTNMEGLFNYCKELESLPNISEWDTSKVTSMNGMFQCCNKLLSLPDLSKWDTSQVRDMEYIFINCHKLISLPDISKWDTSKVTNMHGMFIDCHSLISLPDISKWDVSNVKYMNGMFSLCYSLTDLPDISKWNFQNVISIRGMFNCWSSLKSLPDISKWNLKKGCDDAWATFGSDNFLLKGILKITYG